MSNSNFKAALVPVLNLLTSSLTNFNPFPYDAGFDIEAVTALAVSLPAHSWEYGVTTEALLELYQPQYSVFGASPFPVPEFPRNTSKSLNYVADKVQWGDGRYDALDRGNGAAGDPASMGVAAVMLGKTEPVFRNAARRTAEGLLEDVPRFANGAISHRAALPVLWADFMYMVPPFLAYYAADLDDAELLQETVRQCGLYRDVLRLDTDAPYQGIWRHIIGPEAQDEGAWASGNGWAVAGMVRVLATVIRAPVAEGQPWRQSAIDQLTRYIKEIVDGVMASDPDDGLVRNYMNTNVDDAHRFGEISGTSLVAATIYRMALLRPGTFGQRYIKWADDARATLAGNDRNGNPHVTSTGIVTPAVDPLNWRNTSPLRTGSPEGQAFVVLMYAAWRDCVKATVCDRAPQGSGAGSDNDRRDNGAFAKRSHALQRRTRTYDSHSAK